MSKGAIEAIKQDLKKIQAQIRDLQKDENKLERALALLTTTNPSVGSGPKRTGDEKKVVVRSSVRKEKAASAPKKEPASVTREREKAASKQNTRELEEAPKWAVERRGSAFLDKNGLTAIAREMLRVLLNAPGYSMGTAQLRDDAKVYISSADGARWARELVKMNILAPNGQVPARYGQGRASNAYKLTGKGLQIAQQIQREEDGAAHEEIRIHAGVGVVA